jgi:hypothetical protein
MTQRIGKPGDTAILERQKRGQSRQRQGAVIANTTKFLPIDMPANVKPQVSKDSGLAAAPIPANESLTRTWLSNKQQGHSWAKSIHHHQHPTHKRRWMTLICSKRFAKFEGSTMSRPESFCRICDHLSWKIHAAIGLTRAVW